ncbi:ricin-type beta-trefoil lectin domain protein [Streptomyces sp. NPDC026673]|uniref:ricin-type beta-trefoil lectin domain protein n=1 Tax=Streptomyces sp. NPDC026673 TaxID=3155724 RepID=UPI0033CF3615
MKPSTDNSVSEGLAAATQSATAESESESKPAEESSGAASIEEILTPSPAHEHSAVPAIATESRAESRGTAKARQPEPEVAGVDAAAASNSASTERTTATAAATERPPAAEAIPARAADDAGHNENRRTATGTGATPGKPGKPGKALLAGAAIAGSLLLAVLIPLSLGNNEKRTTGGEHAGSSVLNGDGDGPPGAYSSAGPGKNRGGSGRTGAGAGNSQSGPGTQTTAVGPGTSNSPATGPSDRPHDGATTPGHQGGGSGGNTTPTAPPATTSAAKPPAAAAPPVVVQNSSAPSDKTQIYSHGSGRCIGVVNGPTAGSGARMEIWDCQNVAWHRWTLSNNTVRSQGKCLTLNGGSTADGTAILWKDCNGSSSQRFWLNPAHDLVSLKADKCVDVLDFGTANGSRLQLWSCGGTDNQKWSTRRV